MWLFISKNSQQSCIKTSGSLNFVEKSAMSTEGKYFFEINIPSMPSIILTNVFPDLETSPDLYDLYSVQRRISQKGKRINEVLPEIAKECKIDKKLTMHIARHTFGNISGDRIPIQMLQKLYRHTSITTTIGYQGNFIHKDADEALDAVIGFLDICYNNRVIL